MSKELFEQENLKTELLTVNMGPQHPQLTVFFVLKLKPILKS